MGAMVWIFAKRTLIAAAIIAALAMVWQVVAVPVSGEAPSTGRFAHDDD
jgi:hypothetical protein